MEKENRLIIASAIDAKLEMLFCNRSKVCNKL